MAWATVENWLAFVDAKTARELTVDQDALVQEPDEAKIATALDNATAELEGYVPRIPEAHRPSDATKRVHACKVATYLLAAAKSGKEWESIRNGYTDTIAFYTSLIEQTNAQGASPPAQVGARIPSPVFTPGTLRGLT